MSDKAVVKFLKSLDEDEALKKEFAAKMPKTTDAALVVAFASKNGFDFTADELEKQAASYATPATGKALSDQDLKEVVGGASFGATAFGNVATQILRNTYFSAVMANRLM